MKNETLKYGNYEGSIEPSLEDRCLHGRVLFIQDHITYEGETLNELEQCFQEAVDEYLLTCYQLDREPDKPCSGQFQVRVGPETHRSAMRAAYRDGVSLNEYVKKAVEECLGRGETVRHLHVHRLTLEYVRELPGTELHQDEDQWELIDPVQTSH